MTLRHTIRNALICGLGLFTLSAPAKAKLPATDYWRWFEVEVLVFKHTREQAINEQFPLSVTPVPVSNANDLLSSFVSRDYANLRSALPLCNDWPELGAVSQVELSLSCGWDDESVWIPIPGNPLAPAPALLSLAATPVVIDGEGGDINSASRAFLQPASTHELTETRQQLSRKGLAEPLLHMAWRQPVFTEQHNYQLRLFGGQQFSQQFRYDGYLRTESTPKPIMDQQLSVANIEQLLARIESQPNLFSQSRQDWPARLPTAQQLDNVWELDGLLHIFLIGNYLHIDHRLNFREPSELALTPLTLKEQAVAILNDQPKQQPFLRSYHFDQRRRVISHETHYFDHPKVGMIVQIRRTDLSAPRY